jgi:cytochrome c oxidase subunit III
MAMAEAQKVQHDYHLVDPWPAVGAVAAYLLAVGAILWMHHYTPAAP